VNRSTTSCPPSCHRRAPRSPSVGLACLIHVLHLITGLGIGGAEAMLVKLVTRMDRAHFHNRVVSLLPPGPLAEPLAAAGISVDSLGMRRGLPSPGAFLKLRGLVRQDGLDLIQTWLYHADLLGTLAAASRRNLALAWNVRCSLMDMSDYNWLSRGVRALLAGLSTRPDAVVVNSRAGMAAHARLGYHPRRWELIPNGFDTEQFAPRPEARTRLRAELGLPPDALAIGLPARFDPMKDHASFLTAAVSVSRCLPAARFVLIGRGLDSANAALTPLLASAELAERVLLLGERDDMPNVLNALDVAVLSSAYGEGFPNALGEAMACGVPCVTTDVGDAASLVGDTGRTVPARSPGALAQAIVDLCEVNAECRAALGRRARQRVADRYSLSAITRQYEDLYQDLLGRRNAVP